MRCWHLKCGFFLHEGKLLFASTWGDFTGHFPVKDGKIAQQATGDDLVHPNAVIEVLTEEEWEQHGITEETLKGWKSGYK
ncbi:MAG: hypothetical protein WCX17_03860 [Parcubacteria group bacterium]